MSDPFRDHIARKRSEQRETIRDEYTPLVFWVKTPGNIHNVYKWISDKLDSLPCVTVATKNIPYKYATDGTIHVEDADGNNED